MDPSLIKHLMSLGFTVFGPLIGSFIVLSPTVKLLKAFDVEITRAQKILCWEVIASITFFIIFIYYLLNAISQLES